LETVTRSSIWSDKHTDPGPVGVVLPVARVGDGTPRDRGSVLCASAVALAWRHPIDLGLQNRSVVVTGGSSGIGRAIVTTLLAEGAAVTTCGLQQDKLATLEADLDVPGRLLTQVCDVRDANAVRRLAQTAADRFGGVDGVVCNAGRGHSGGVLDATDDAWRDDYEVKVLGMLHTVRACLPALRRSDQPRVVVIGGATASRPHPQMAAVSASRAALLNVAALLAAASRSVGSQRRRRWRM
jgi:NAD(P)-dependent dehydrogenase (short-subunit alcohol dehydrogenase family)